MDIDKIKEAYSGRDDEGLYKALQKFHENLVLLVYSVGPALAMLQLQEDRVLGAILHKVSSVADSGTIGERLAYQAGAVSAYLSNLQEIASRQKVDEADAQLSNLPDQGAQANSVRITILKYTYSHTGERLKHLTDLVVRYSKVKKNLVGVCLRELLEMGLVERVTWANRVISYRITHLGGAVLMRRMMPYDIPLFFIDLAASDAEMRSAMRDEIKRTWPLKDLTLPDEELRAISARRDETKRMFPLKED